MVFLNDLIHEPGGSDRTSNCKVTVANQKPEGSGKGTLREQLNNHNNNGAVQVTCGLITAFKLHLNIALENKVNKMPPQKSNEMPSNSSCPQCSGGVNAKC